MKIILFAEKILLTLVFIILGGCGEIIEPDPCALTKWPLSKVYEIKLAVQLSKSNPLFQGGTPGSQKPEEFKKMAVSGTIEKVECNDETTGPVNLGNTYFIQEEEPFEPPEEPITYWIGHVVYVYEFDNDEDKINIKLTVKVTMADGQSYRCTLTKEYFSQEIEQMPGELYYFILTDIYSNVWVKV